MFGQPDPIITGMLQEIQNGNDEFLIGVDFKNYINAQDDIDRVFKDKKEFCKRSMLTLANCGKFSSDKNIMTLCEEVWDVKSVDVPKPAINAKERVRSSTNLLGS